MINQDEFDRIVEAVSSRLQISLPASHVDMLLDCRRALATVDAARVDRVAIIARVVARHLVREALQLAFDELQKVKRKITLGIDPGASGT